MNTGENDKLVICAKCGAEHFVRLNEIVKSCDVCGIKFEQPDEDKGEDQENETHH